MLRIINNSKTSTAVRSAELYMDAVEQAIMKENLKDEFNPSVCTIRDNGNIYCLEREIEIQATGNKPTGGTIILKNGKITGVIKLALNDYILGTDKDENLVILETVGSRIPLNPEGTYLKGYSDSEYLGGNLASNSIESLVVTNTKKVPSDALGSWDATEAQDESVMGWYYDNDGNGLYEVYIGGDGGVKAPPDSTSLFSLMRLSAIDVTYLDTSDVTDMSYMFAFIGTSNEEDGLKKYVDIDVSNFDTSKVTNMEAMFGDLYAGMLGYDSNINSITLGNNFDTSQVTNMKLMFGGCRNLTELDLSKFDTSQVINIGSMFGGCTNLQTLDLSNFDLSKVSSINNFFTIGTRIGKYNLKTIYVKDQHAKDLIESALANDSEYAQLSDVEVIIA